MKKTYLVTWIISCLLLVAAAAMLFTNWINIAPDRDDRKQVKAELEELKADLDDASRNINYLKSELDDYDIDVSARKLLKAVKLAYSDVRDMALSPSELSGLAFSILPLSSLEKDLDDDEALGFAILKWVSLVMAILFYSILALSVLMLLLHILGKKLSGYLLTCLYLVLFGICLAAAGAADSAVQDIFYLDLDGSLLKLTATPYLAVFFSLASSILWSVTKRLRPAKPAAPANQPGNPYAAAQYSPYTAPQSASPASANNVAQQYTKTCKSCGSVMRADMTYCMNCGSRQ